MTGTCEGIVIYGAAWCPDARRARRFLDDQKLDYRWIDIDEDDEALDFVRRTNGGQVIVPVLIFPDESILVEPTNDELARKMESLFWQSQL